MDHSDWEPVPEPSASPFVDAVSNMARRISSLRAPDSSSDADGPRPGSDSSSDIDDGPILARQAERISERRKLTFSGLFDGPPGDDAADDSGEPQPQAYPLPPAAPAPGVVGHTPVPAAPDQAVVEAALQALHANEESPAAGVEGNEDDEGGRGAVYLDTGLEEELEDLRAQAQVDAEALEAAQEENWALKARTQALEAQVAALSSKLEQAQQQQAPPPPVPESDTLAALRKDVQELEHLLAASQKENERATLAVKEARQEAALKVAAAEAEASAVKAELAVIRTETQLAGKPAAAAAAPADGEGVDAHLASGPATAGQLRRILALEAALEQAQEAGAAKERAAAAEVEALREQLDAAQRQLAARHSDSSRAHMREAAAARAAAAVARTSMTAGVAAEAASPAAGAHLAVVDAQTQAPPTRMNDKLLRQLRAEHEAVRAAYEDRLAVSEAAAAKGVAAAARVRALERELTEARAHASRRVRAVQDEAEAAARERDVVAQELDALRKEAGATKRREVDILRREREAKTKCMAAEEAAARAKEDLRDVTHRLQMLEAAHARLQQREEREEQVVGEAAPPAAAAPRRSSSAGAARQRAAPPQQQQLQQGRSGSEDVNALLRKLEAAQMSLQAMTRAHGEAVEKAAAARLESEKALWQLQTAHAERLDALHQDKLTLEAELKALLSAAGDGASNPASHDDVRYALAAAARRADAADQRAAQLEAQLRSARHMRGGGAHLDGLAARIAAAESAAAKLASRVEAREAECRALIREVARLEALTAREEHRGGGRSGDDGGGATLEVTRALDARKLEVTRFRAALDAVLEGAAGRWEDGAGAVAESSRQGAAA